MEKFDLPEALLGYRKEHKLSIRKMADMLHMSKSAYARLEKGLTKPTYEQVPWILSVLGIEAGSVTIEAEPTPSVKWYRSKKWRWLLPIIYAYLLMDLVVTMKFANYVNGKQILHDNVPYLGLTIMGISFCLIYWYFFPPPLPFKLSRKPLNSVQPA